MPLFRSAFTFTCLVVAQLGLSSFVLSGEPSPPANNAPKPKAAQDIRIPSLPSRQHQRQSKPKGPLIVGISPTLPAPIPFYDKLKPSGKRFERERYHKRPGADKYEVWQLLIEELSRLSKIPLQSPKRTGTLGFERQLAQGVFDLAYIDPRQFVQGTEYANYSALAKAKAKPARGILVARKDSQIKTLRDIDARGIVYPYALNFSASIVPRASLAQLGFELPAHYVADEHAALQAVLRGQFPAAAGTAHNFAALSPPERAQLKVVWDTPSYTPDAFVAHQRLAFFDKTRLQKALVQLFKTELGKRLLPLVGVDNGFESAKDRDWQDARAIDFSDLEQQSGLPKPSRAKNSSHSVKPNQIHSES